jgi:hypothetical protein
MLPRRFVFFGSLVLSATACFVACGFPDITFAPDGDAEAPADATGPGNDATSNDGAVADGASDAGIDAATLPDGAPEPIKDAGTVDATPVDTSGCHTCDCDGDGFNVLDLAAGCDGGPGGKLPDCDDTNAAIHPGNGLIESPWPSGSDHAPPGDWDCSGTTTTAYASGATCASLSNCANGFRGTPPCGGTADFLTCQALISLLGIPLGCGVKSTEPAGTRIQSCQ